MYKKATLYLPRQWHGMSEGFVTNCLAVHKLGSPHFPIFTSNGFLGKTGFAQIWEASRKCWAFVITRRQVTRRWTLACEFVICDPGIGGKPSLVEADSGLWCVPPTGACLYVAVWPAYTNPSMGGAQLQKVKVQSHNAPQAVQFQLLHNWTGVLYSKNT